MLQQVIKLLQRRKIAVRNLKAVETMGDVTCVLSDIDFTQNNLVLKHIWLNNKLSNEYVTQSLDDDHFRLFQRCALLSCNAVPTGSPLEQISANQVN